MWREVFQADAVMGGHLHTPAMQQELANGLARRAGFSIGGNRILILAGTANTDAEYALYAYGGGGAAIWPCVMFWPGQRRSRGFWTFNDALIYRRGLTNE